MTAGIADRNRPAEWPLDFGKCFPSPVSSAPTMVFFVKQLLRSSSHLPFEAWCKMDCVCQAMVLPHSGVELLFVYTRRVIVLPFFNSSCLLASKIFLMTRILIEYQ
jgi:hypothetical protein